MSQPPQGPDNSSFISRLKRLESRNATYQETDWPIVWERAAGNHVYDVTGQEYLDLTAGFGVASVGHCNPAVVQAITEQSQSLLHAMGDVHPASARVQLLELISHRLPGGLAITL